MKKQSGAALSRLAGKYLRLSLEDFEQMETHLVYRDVLRLAGSVEGRRETPPKKKAKR